MQDHYAVYQYLVNKFGGVSFDTPESFQEAVTTGAATKRFVPSKTWGMFNIDTKEVLAEGYLCRYGFDLVKVSKGVVTEYYRRLLSNKRWAFIAYDVETLEPKERYQNIGNQLCKFDWLTGQPLQANNNCTFDSLPTDFQSEIQTFPYRKNVFMYAIKPYGRVVEFSYPK